MREEASVMYRLFWNEFQKKNYPNAYFDGEIRQLRGYSIDTNVILRAIGYNPETRGYTSDGKRINLTTRANQWLDSGSITIYQPTLEELILKIYGGYLEGTRELLDKPHIRFLLSKELSEPTIWERIREFDSELLDRLDSKRTLSGPDRALVGLSAIEGSELVTFDTDIISFKYDGLKIRDCWNERPTKPSLPWKSI